jgi:hypothetical protein
MYEERHGPIPAGLELDHTCKRRLRQPGTPRSRDPRRERPRGGAAKLTPDDVEMIRELHGSVPCDALAWSLGVSPRTIRAVASGEAWRDAA